MVVTVVSVEVYPVRYVNPTDLPYVMINDLEDAVPNHLPISTNKYADDCTEHELISLNSQGNMQEVVDEVVKWASNNKMELNSKKTKDMWICFSNKIPHS